MVGENIDVQMGNSSSGSPGGSPGSRQRASNEDARGSVALAIQFLSEVNDTL